MNKAVNKAKLLLINPWIYDFTAYDFWSKPLGLLYIAALLRQQGYHIDYIDCLDRFKPDLLGSSGHNLPKTKLDGRGPFYKEKVSKPESLKHIPRNYCRYGITEKAFLEKVMNLDKPNAVLVTSIMTYWYPGVFRTIELVKKIYPDCPIILGGIYASLCSEHAVALSGADYVINNTHLNTLLPLLQKITSASNDKYNYNGGESINLQDINSYPYPAWDLYPALDYVCVVTSRGCPNRCSYCASALLNTGLQFRSPLKVVNEIAYWKEQRGITNFAFYDDALLVQAEKHIIPLLAELKKRSLNINLYTPNALHVRFITQPVAQLMLECGFQKIWLGLETVDPKLQKKTGNKVDNASFLKSVKTLLEAGFSPGQIRVYLLIGLPGQNFSTIIDSIKLVLDNGIKPYLAKFSPIPGIAIWKQTIKEYGWQEPVDPLWHNDALMPYCSPYLNSEQYQQIKMLIQNSSI